MSNPLFKVMCSGFSTGGGESGGGTDELGTQNNPYIFSDIFDSSTQCWTNFINVNVNANGGCWIKVELNNAYSWLMGVSWMAEDGSYVNSTIELYDSNFGYTGYFGIYPPPDAYLEVDGLQVGSAVDYSPQIDRRLLYSRFK